MQNKPYLKSLVTLLKPAFFIIGLIVVIAVYESINYKNYETNGTGLMQSDSWLYFPGAKIMGANIHFQPLNRIITHQDGSVGQPNPPINLSKHLLVKGDFKITATLLSIDKQASFRLYSEPPIIYDKWRYESPSIDINVTNNFVTVRIWDGSSSNSMDIRIYPAGSIPLRGEKTFPTHKTVISIEHIKDEINIFENKQLLGSMPDHNIFSSGTIWFGTDGLAGSYGWTLAGLIAEAIGDGSVKIISAPSLIVSQSDPNSLRNLADANPRKLKIGATVAIGRLFTDERYKKLAIGQFSMLTPENSMKPQFIHPEPNTYVFEEADQLVDAALSNGIIVHGHALIYDKSSPKWMVKSLKFERQQIMVSHIENIVSHFKGKVAEWDVINEPFSGKNALYKNGGAGLEPNIWFEAMDERYIDIAFKTAHEADPSAKLYLNDYGLENDGQRWDALLGLVKRLKQRGVPIDGVGFEAHIYGDGDYVNPDQLKKHMKILADLGLLTRISEIDVTGDDPQEQINQYTVVLDACLKELNCTSYTTWGITDLYGSTTKSDRYPLVYGNSLLWDKDMKEKPAYTAIQNRLKQ